MNNIKKKIKTLGKKKLILGALIVIFCTIGVASTFYQILMAMSNFSSDEFVSKEAINESENNISDDINDVEEKNDTNDVVEEETDIADTTSTDSSNAETSSNETSSNSSDTDCMGISCDNFAKNYDGSYATIDSYSISESIQSINGSSEDEYAVYLLIDGTVEVKYNSSKNNVLYPNGNVLDDATSFILFVRPAPVSYSDLYILTANGDLYVYNFPNLEEEIYTSTKTEYSNISRIFTYTPLERANAGAVTYLYGITNDNNLLVIDTSSV